MKPIYLFSAFIFSLHMASISHAGTESADYDTVSSISIGSTGTLYIFMDNSEINPGNCANEGRYALSADSEQYKIIYAQILTAMVAGYEVKFAIYDDECVDAKSKSYPSVARSAMRTP